MDDFGLTGGPDDDVITPWQSSHFGFYNENGDVVPLHQRSIYTDDTIGLKTLDELGKLHLMSFADVRHYAWHLNITVIDQALLPHLD
jgi:palmitoyl-protein thioesterase